MEIKDYSKIYRIIHWTMAITFALLLITIFLRMTWMNKYNVAAIIQSNLNNTDQLLSQEQIISIAKQIREPMWKWHIYLGYLLTGLFSLRFMLPLFGKMKFQNPFQKNQSTKQKLIKWVYLIFYLCVITSLFTGLVMKFGAKEFKKPMEAIHVLGIYYLIGFIVMHVAGVLIAEFTNQKGIVSRIVSGSNKKK